MEEVARSLNLGVKEIKNRVAELHELNPMLVIEDADWAYLFQRSMRCNAGQFFPH